MKEPVGIVSENVVIACVDDPRIYSDKEMKELMYALYKGDELTMLESFSDKAKIQTASGETAWIFKKHICTKKQFKIREKLRTSDGLIISYDEKIQKCLMSGALNIVNNQFVLSEGQVIWMDESAQGKECTIAGQKFIGDPDVLYKYAKGGITKVE